VVDRGRADRVGLGSGVPAEDAAMFSCQFGASVDAKFLGEPPADTVEDHERIGLLAGGRKRPNESGVQWLVERMLRGQMAKSRKAELWSAHLLHQVGVA
jgi:hypothetical protein